MRISTISAARIPRTVRGNKFDRLFKALAAVTGDNALRVTYASEEEAKDDQVQMLIACKRKGMAIKTNRDGTTIYVQRKGVRDAFQNSVR